MGMCGKFIKSLTTNSTTSPASSKVVNNGGVALNSAIDCEVASKACVSDVVVLENHDGGLYGVSG